MEQKMNKQPPLKDRRPIPGADNENLRRVKSNTRLIVVGVLLAVVMITAVSVWAQTYNVSLLSGDNAEVACDGRGMQVQRTSRTSVNIICSGPNDNPQPTTEPTNPPPQPTNPPPQPTTPPIRRRRPRLQPPPPLHRHHPRRVAISSRMPVRLPVKRLALPTMTSPGTASGITNMAATGTMTT
jgi:hypothetical protein